MWFLAWRRYSSGSDYVLPEGLLGTLHPQARPWLHSLAPLLGEGCGLPSNPHVHWPLGGQVSPGCWAIELSPCGLSSCSLRVRQSSCVTNNSFPLFLEKQNPNKKLEPGSGVNTWLYVDIPWWKFAVDYKNISQECLERNWEAKWVGPGVRYGHMQNSWFLPSRDASCLAPPAGGLQENWRAEGHTAQLSKWWEADSLFLPRENRRRRND